jgi:ATP adenylyltransferase
MSDSLWAPWRIGYITGVDKSERPSDSTDQLALLPGADPKCFLCRGAAESKADDAPAADRRNLVIGRTSLSIAILNRYPYNNGHLLVAPRRHVPNLVDLISAEHLDLMQLIARLCDIIEKTMKAEGFNIGLNLGRVAGAGVPGHLHWHLVPRWNGDTNFMPVLAGVNVLPQSLDALFDLLHGALKSTSS